MKIKIITASSSKGLEAEVNKFIRNDLNVIDISYSESKMSIRAYIRYFEK